MIKLTIILIKVPVIKCAENGKGNLLTIITRIKMVLKSQVKYISKCLPIFELQYRYFKMTCTHTQHICVCVCVFMHFYIKVDKSIDR